MMDDEKMSVEAEELVNKILDGIANGNLDMEMKDSYFPERVCIIEGLPEYYGTAEPPVRCGESHLSGLTEPLHFVY